MHKKAIDQSAAILDSDVIALALVRDRHIVWANRTAHRIFGYAPDELIGQPTRKLFAEQQSYELIGREAYSAIERGQTYHCEIQLQRKDGSTGWFQFNASQLEGSGNTVVAAIQNITDKRTLELAQQSSEERYRTVVEDQTEVICRFLPDGTFTFVNETYCRLFGKTPDQLIGKQWHPDAHPADLPMIEARLGELSIDNPSVIIENRVLVADGRMRWMQFINRGFFDTHGSLIETQSVGRDITDLKTIEQQLRDREERLNLALFGSGLAVWDRDMTTGKVVTDMRVSEMLGYPSEALDCEAVWGQLVDPRDRDRVERSFSAHLQGDTEFIHSEHRLRHKDGHWVTVEMRAKIIHDDSNGAPLRLIGTLLDVTQRRRLNDEGVNLLKQIESLIRETSAGSAAGAIESEALESLTKRERQILGMIAAGMSSAQIGTQLKLATNTVTNHRQNMMAKLDLHNTAEITRFAIDHGLMKD